MKHNNLKKKQVTEAVRQMLWRKKYNIYLRDVKNCSTVLENVLSYILPVCVCVCVCVCACMHVGAMS